MNDGENGLYVNIGLVTSSDMEINLSAHTYNVHIWTSNVHQESVSEQHQGHGFDSQGMHE